MRISRTKLTAVTTLVFSALAVFVVAGPLSPPGGPVASTYKTLAEVEPRIAINSVNTPGDAAVMYRITKAGSYYLTGDVTAAALKHGIEVTANNVSIDLRGFSVIGTGSGIYNGINVGAQTNVTVTNGTLRTWGGAGVNAQLSAGGHLKDLQLLSDGDGIRAGKGALIEHCAAAYSNNIGIAAENGSLVVECVAYGCDTGIYLSSGSIARNCHASSNDYRGYGTEDGAAFESCSATENTGDGFHVSWNISMDNCISSDNGGVGFSFGSNCRLTNNHAESNAGTAGFYGGTSSSRNVLKGNTAVSNAGSGFKLAANANLIIANQATLNGSNYDIVAGNRIGPVVVFTTSSASGNSGGAGTSDPSANLAF